jgi:predicted murein hydrolase (TIGR00659 family)
MSDMLQWKLFTPLFGFFLSPLIYLIARRLYQKTGWMAAHPLLVSSAVIIGLLQTADLSYEFYYNGARLWNWLVGPATVALAVPVYRQRQSLFSNWQAVFCGVISGSVVGVFAVWLMGRLIGLADPVTLSLIPKSVTIPIAVGISTAIGGIPSLTVCAGIVTGIFGAMVGPAVMKLFRVQHDVSRGLALGTTAHGAGVQQALQANQTQGAMAGLSVGVVGFVSAIIIPLLVRLLF